MMPSILVTTAIMKGYTAPFKKIILHLYLLENTHTYIYYITILAIVN